MEELTIGAVAQRAGIRSSAIRYYESVEVLPAPRRINGRRLYDSSVLDRLAVIQMAQQAGFTVSEIRTLFNGFAAETPASARWEALARQKLVEVDALIRRAQAMKRVLEEELLRCRCLTLDECARCIRDQGESETLIPVKHLRE
jgi:MerR family transcriptional regulator, redox-sensitive transcriptional activator SoxR